ncbi:MAG: C39 family peptidase [Anaerolineae bacterium]
MSRRPLPRRSSALATWLALGGAVVGILAIALVGLWAWQQAAEIRALEDEIQVLYGQRQETRAQLADLQATAAVLEQQLSDLQADAAAQGGAAADAQATDDVQADLETVTARLDRLEAALSEALGRIEAVEATGTGDPPPAALPAQARLAVAAQRQSHNLSCESAAAAMVARYYGLALSEAQILAALPASDNPYLGFRGNVDGTPGGIEDYGVYAGPILNVLNDHGLGAELVQGGLAGIQAAIASGRPVIAWITYDCQYSTPVTRTVGGAVVSLVPYQHAVVVTGYDGDGVWANDPWDGQEDFYAAADFERALAYFGDMAIVVSAPASSQ